MDNLSIHKVSDTESAVREVGASIMFLSPYSPDFNPIELMWSKTKAILRKLKILTKELLNDAIAQALDAVNCSDIVG